MGSTESKMAASAPAKPEPAIKNNRINHLIDPRSPSTGIDRTPIQVSGLVTKVSAEVKSDCALAFGDPRSPSVGISRTPVRESMRATVGCFARRLGIFFHNESEVRKSFHDAVQEVGSGDEELASNEPLLTRSPRTFGSIVDHGDLEATPALQAVGNSSPFVLLAEPQVEVEIETEADVTLEEAEEAVESPLNKRLSMSLITCHEGATSSQIFAEVHCDGAPCVDGVLHQDGVDHVDHSYTLPSVTVESSQPAEPEASPAPASPEQPEETEEVQPPVDASPVPPVSVPSAPPAAPVPEQPQPCGGIRCPTFDTKSPSQVVFKPQWLGRGFGATGLRARGVQGRGEKGGSSPLAVRLAVKNVNNENKGLSGKMKQKGSEGRSPLQILKETNSPRDRPQTKVKPSTPDKQRRGQMDRRVLAVSLDKENR